MEKKVQGTIGRDRLHQLQVKSWEDDQVSAAHPLFGG
jgi:hypothetical protein